MILTFLVIPYLPQSIVLLFFLKLKILYWTQVQRMDTFALILISEVMFRVFLFFSRHWIQSYYILPICIKPYPLCSKFSEIFFYHEGTLDFASSRMITWFLSLYSCGGLNFWFIYGKLSLYPWIEYGFIMVHILYMYLNLVCILMRHN